MTSTSNLPLGRALGPVIVEITSIAARQRQRSRTVYLSLMRIVSELETLVDDEQLGLIGRPPEWRCQDDQ